MAKRFTDTDKWKKPFLRKLKSEYKLLWVYILDECDHAGIWQVDFDVAEIKLGEKLNMEDAIESFEGKIHVFDEGQKWFIYDFIDFQYGELSKGNNAHNSVIRILDKYKIKYKIKPLTSSSRGDQDKDKDKDKEKDKDKDNIETRKLKFAETLKPYLKEYGKPMITEFYKYWTEHGDDDVKFRREKEKTWGLKRRLSTWKNNNFNKIDDNSTTKTVLEMSKRIDHE
jgi:hypothetical protein